jgi:hypothetical protein
MRCRDAAKTALSSHDDCGEQYQLAIEMSIGYLEGEAHRRDSALHPRPYRHDAVASILPRSRRVIRGFESDHRDPPGSGTSLGSDVADIRIRQSTSVFDIDSRYKRKLQRHTSGGCPGCPGFQDPRIFMAAAELMGRDVQPDSWGVLGGCATLLSRATPCVTAQCRASFGIISSGSFSVDFRNRCLLLALIVPHVKRPQARRTTRT